MSPDEADTGSQLPLILKLIEEHDTDYDARYPLVLWALSVAADEGYQAGIRIDPSQPEWPVVYIALPQGQISWHMPQFPDAWDGHDTPTKYARVRAFIDSAAG
jgi:hypothetical protein